MNSKTVITIEQWRLLKGDPTGIGWIITITYFLTFIICLWAGITAQKHKNKKEIYGNGCMLLWIALLLLLLGINKQLDFQVLFTIIGRNLAKKQGWYNIRSVFQTIFVVSFLLIVLILFILWAGRIKGRWRQCGFHFVGTALILFFVMIRAASIEHISFGHAAQYDTVIHSLLSFFELSGILVVCLGSVLFLRRLNASKRRDYKFDWE